MSDAKTSSRSIGVCLGVVVEPRQRLAMRPAEAVSEVAEFHRCQVLHQAEQVRSGRNQRSANVVFGEAIQLPQDCFSAGLEVAMEIRFGGRHLRILADCQQRSRSDEPLDEQSISGAEPSVLVDVVGSSDLVGRAAGER